MFKGTYWWKYCCVEYLRFSCLCSPLGLLWCCDLVESFIHMEFLFVYGIIWCLSFIFLHVALQISQHHFLNRLFWLHFKFCPFSQILIHCKSLSLFLGSLFCSIDLCVCSYASTRLFWSQWPCNIVWHQVLWSLLLCSYFSKLLTVFGVIYGSI